jgi:hypothetical protein
MVQNDEFSGCFNKPMPKTSPFANGNFSFGNAAFPVKDVPEPSHRNFSLEKRDVFLMEGLNPRD